MNGTTSTLLSQPPIADGLHWDIRLLLWEHDKAIQSGSFDSLSAVSKRMSRYLRDALGLDLVDNVAVDHYLEQVQSQGERALKDLESDISAIKHAVGGLVPRRELALFVRGPPNTSSESVCVTDRDGSTSAKIYYPTHIILPREPPPHLPQDRPSNKGWLIDSCKQYMAELQECLCKEADVGMASRIHLARSGCQVLDQVCSFLDSNDAAHLLHKKKSDDIVLEAAHQQLLLRVRDLAAKQHSSETALKAVENALMVGNSLALAEMAVNFYLKILEKQDQLNDVAKEFVTERKKALEETEKLRATLGKNLDECAILRSKIAELQSALHEASLRPMANAKPLASYEQYSTIMEAALALGPSGQALREALDNNDPMSIALTCIELLQSSWREEDENWDVVINGEKKIVTLRELLQTVRRERDELQQRLAQLELRYNALERSHAELLGSFNEVNDHLKEAYRSKEADSDALRRAHQRELEDIVTKYQELMRRESADHKLLIDKEKATTKALLSQLQLLSH